MYLFFLYSHHHIYISVFSSLHFFQSFCDESFTFILESQPFPALELTIGLYEKFPVSAFLLTLVFPAILAYYNIGRNPLGIKIQLYSITDW